METFGRYQLHEKLGQGGMGVVYRAFDTVLERTVALKLVLSTEGIEPELRERLFREARAAGNLKHKNIVTIYDLGEQDTRPYLAMEYLEGEDLQRRLRRPEKMSLLHKLDLAIEICDGLAHAHAHNVIHRDIKPANIFITEHGSAKLLDFGLARLMTSQLTRSNMLMGTINYMAPEQVKGERADNRSDIFSTGVLLYELLGGRKAFEGDSAASTLMKILQDAPEPLWKLDPTVPRELAAIVERTLAKLPDERYQSMEQLRHDLEAFRDRYRSTSATALPGQPPELDATVLSTTPVPSAMTASPLAASRPSTPALSTAPSAEPSSGPAAAPRRRGLNLAVAAGAIVAIAVPGVWWFTHRSAEPAAPSSAVAAPPQTTAAAPPQASNPAPQPSPAPAQDSKTERAVTERLHLAQQSLDAHDYTAALTGAEAVLLVDPGNADAERIRAAARDGAAVAARPPHPGDEGQTARARPDSRRTAKADASQNAGVPDKRGSGDSARPPASEKPPTVSPSAPPAPVSAAPPPGTGSSVAPPPAPIASAPLPGSSTPASTTPSPGAAPPASSSAAPATDGSRAAAPTEQIAAVLDQYKQALEARSLDQLQRLWPSLDSTTKRGIQDQFDIAKRIRVDIVNPQIAVTGASAQVSFTRRYRVDTVDGEHPDLTTRALMDLRRNGNTWVIVGIRFP